MIGSFTTTPLGSRLLPTSQKSPFTETRYTGAAWVGFLVSRARRQSRRIRPDGSADPTATLPIHHGRDTRDSTRGTYRLARLLRHGRRIPDKDEFATLLTNTRPTANDPALVVLASPQVREVLINFE
jgi:hypothetical protein